MDFTALSIYAPNYRTIIEYDPECLQAISLFVLHARSFMTFWYGLQFLRTEAPTCELSQTRDEEGLASYKLVMLSSNFPLLCG